MSILDPILYFLMPILDVKKMGIKIVKFFFGNSHFMDRLPKWLVNAISVSVGIIFLAVIIGVCGYILAKLFPFTMGLWPDPGSGTDQK